MDIETLRKEIDEIDYKIINLLSSRQKLVKKIAVFKKKNSKKAMDNKRWSLVLESRKKLAESLDLSSKNIEEIWNLIHKESLEVENKIIQK